MKYLGFLKNKIFWIGLALIAGGITGLLYPNFVKYLFGVAILVGMWVILYVLYVENIL